MKKTAILILIFTIFIISCSKDNVIEQSHGTKLTSIQYEEDNDSWIVNYSYSSNNELIKIEDFRSLGRRYEIDYRNSILKEYTTYRMDEEKLVFRDSIIYNSNGTIQAIHNFSINSGEDMPLSWIFEYEYNAENKVSKKSTYCVITQEYTSIEKYYWNGDNIGRVEYYNGNKKLYYEYFYKYDDKINYKKEIPINISYPINRSKNNVTEMNWKDYLGNLDIVCRPCVAKYKYNLDNYPVSIETNWGRKVKLKYK